MGVVARIILKGKGNYDPTETYEELDYVRYANCSWVATKTLTGVTPPSDPTIPSSDWCLLCEDGQYLGQYPSWSNVTMKPFETLDSNAFVVVNGELSVVFPTYLWSSVSGKPFETVSDSFDTSNNELDIKVDGTTIYKLADGTLVANASSMGFNIHNLQEETALANNDEFPFYDSSIAGQRKTTWSNIISKLATVFTRIYGNNAVLVGDTTVKDTVEDINDNVNPNQLAGALALKTIYQNIAPKPNNAPAFSSSSKYGVGDIVSYNSDVYYCKTAITTPKSWNASDWELWGDNKAIRLGITDDGEYGYYKVGADSVTPFKKGGHLVKAYVGNVTTSANFDIARLFPNVDLTDVTNDNFCLVQSGVASGDSGQGNRKDMQVWGWGTGTYKHQYVDSRVVMSGTASSYSYNPSTHILSVTSGSVSATGYGIASGLGSGTSSMGTSARESCYVYFIYIDK